MYKRQGQNPPVVVIHGTQTDALPSSYRRYLEKIFRRELALHGTPIRIELRSGSNPYSGKRNKFDSAASAAAPADDEPYQKI